MKNILLPTDFSENSWNSIAYGLRFFEKNTCNFYVLHVNRLSHLATGDIPYITSQEEINNLYLKPSKKHLKDLLKRISTEMPNNKRHNFYLVTDYNFFIESIRKQVDEKKIDMIVMGTKGASGLKEHIIGSNTGDVITKVKCSTLVIPENATYTSIEEVAFPTDFAITYNPLKLKLISNILKKTNASLRILHISKKDVSLNAEQQQNKGLLEDFFEQFKCSLHFLTNKTIEDSIQCFVESREIDMMVMIAKNLNYFQQILFHPKVEKISYHTNIPFLVLHE